MITYYCTLDPASPPSGGRYALAYIRAETAKEAGDIFIPYLKEHNVLDRYNLHTLNVEPYFGEMV